MRITLENFFNPDNKRNYFVILILSVVALLSMFNVYKIGSAPVWDGEIYHKLCGEFIQGGYSFKAIKADYLANNQLKVSYTYRILFIWLVAMIHKLTGIALVYIYPVINFVSLLFTAFFLYLISKKYFKMDYKFALFSGIWFLLIPSVTIMYQVVAHPEPLALLFTVLTYYFFLKKRHIPGAIFLFLGILTKQSLIFIYIFILIKSLLNIQNDSFREKTVFLNYTIPVVFGLLLPHFLLPTQNNLFDKNIILLIISQNREHVFQNILYNFEVLWVPFLLQFINEPRDNKISFILMTMASVGVVLTTVTDWWRAWFAILFVFVIPLSSVNVYRNFSKTMSNGKMIIIYFLITLLLLKPTPYLNFDYIYKPNFTNYFIVIILLYLNSVVTKVFFSNNKASGVD